MKLSWQVSFLHSSAAKALAENASVNPDQYERSNPEDWMAVCSSPVSMWHINSLENPLPTGPEIMESLAASACNAASDAQDSISLHSALGMLTPQQAADYRLWVGLTHFELYEYVRRRWESPRLATSLDDTHRERKVRYIRTHWFVSGARGLVRDNGVSRLWWMGHILKKIADQLPLEPEEVGQILFERTDVRAQLIERPATASNIRLAAEITSVLKSERQLIERAAFRRWMIALNQLGGIVLLDALRRDDLRRVVHEQANAALRSP